MPRCASYTRNRVDASSRDVNGLCVKGRRVSELRRGLRFSRSLLARPDCLLRIYSAAPVMCALGSDPTVRARLETGLLKSRWVNFVGHVCCTF